MLKIKKEELEQKSKEILSVQIKNMENAGFGYLSEIVRTAIFQNDNYKKTLLPIFLKNNPDVVVE